MEGKNEKINVTVPETGVLGIVPSIFDEDKLVVTEYSVAQAIPAGVVKAMDILDFYIAQMGLLFVPETEAYKKVGGFAAMTKNFPTVWDWQSFWKITAFFSIVLAFMNILPIPALDGGHALFLFYEIIVGKKPADKFLEYAQMVGMILVLMLLVVANGNDLLRWITG